jgi:hypothetical protein
MSLPSGAPPLFDGNTIYSYWRTVSEGKISLAGSVVVEWKNSTQPANSSWTRTQIVQACLDATLADQATAKKLGDLSQFYALIVHAPLSGIDTAVGSANPTLKAETLAINNSSVLPAIHKRRTVAVISDAATGLLATTTLGPMALAYGLVSADETSGNSGDGDELLGDPGSGFNGFGQFGLCAQHLDYLGWIPSAAHYSFNTSQMQNDLSGTYFTLKALGAVGATPAGEYQEIRLQPLDPAFSQGLTVEFRRQLPDPSGFGINSYLFKGELLIYQGVYPNGSASTLRLDSDSPNNLYSFTSFTHTMHPGDTFFDFNDLEVIYFDSINDADNTARILISPFGGS